MKYVIIIHFVDKNNQKNVISRFIASFHIYLMCSTKSKINNSAVFFYRCENTFIGLVHNSKSISETIFRVNSKDN